MLIHGAAGGVGHLAVQIAKARGANVIATARAEQAEWLRELGAERDDRLPRASASRTWSATSTR